MKIDLSFLDYDKKMKNNEKKALLLLKRRVKYLTSNTRLINNKRNIIIDIDFQLKKKLLGFLGRNMIKLRCYCIYYSRERL
ncbi:hypothetical protein ATZ36_15640 [Candidatus Endomicrobiellum trichonymphae]|uniref:Uncharacterized protein n=1 Tax=Endomicrobium trichonymphae TaxID=1408204 RepID=A0A1E5IM88_ENDTX|nr:hypothetical protein ATZ36_15640 [Candidatus Endomicrobium trichonymphae]